MKHLKLITLIIFSLILNLTYANVGDLFPEIIGENLDNQKVNLPKASKGKFCLIGMASSKKAEEDLKTWMQPVYDLFINQNTFMQIDYNMDIYFMPIFTGVNQVSYNAVMKKTKEDIDPELAAHVLFYKGSIDVFEEKLGLKDSTIPYFFVVDENGKIVYATSGKYSDKKLEKIESFILD